METEAQREKQRHTASGGGEQPGEMVALAHARPYGAAPESPVPPRTVWLPREAHHVLMTGSPATGQLLTGLFQRLNRWKSSEAIAIGLGLGLGLGLWPASCSSFSLSLAPSHPRLFFPGASEPAHQTGGFSKAPVSPHPLGVPGPLALGDWPALVNVSSLSGVCLEAPTQSLTLPEGQRLRDNLQTHADLALHPALPPPSPGT